MSSKKTVHVVAAVICGDGERVLIAKRLASAHQGGLWEFPGGKVDQGEAPSEALIRELDEELGIKATEFHPLIQVHHDYADKSVFLDVWKVTQFDGDPVGVDGRGAEGQLVQWVSASDLRRWEFPAANSPIVRAAQLPQDYMITRDIAHFLGDASGEVGDEGVLLLNDVERALNQGCRLIQLRTKSLSRHQQQSVNERVLLLCNDASAVLILNSGLSDLSGVDKPLVGLHLTAEALGKSQEKPAGYRFVAASCHNLNDIRKAEMLDLDFITLSPVQFTRSHPGAAVLGWQTFESMVERALIPVYALGGMTRAHRQQAIDSGGQGVASISRYLLRGGCRLV